MVDIIIKWNWPCIYDLFELGQNLIWAYFKLLPKSTDLHEFEEKHYRTSINYNQALNNTSVKSKNPKKLFHERMI